MSRENNTGEVRWRRWDGDNIVSRESEKAEGSGQGNLAGVLRGLPFPLPPPCLPPSPTTSTLRLKYFSPALDPQLLR